MNKVNLKALVCTSSNVHKFYITFSASLSLSVDDRERDREREIEPRRTGVLAILASPATLTWHRAMVYCHTSTAFIQGYRPVAPHAFRR